MKLITACVCLFLLCQPGHAEDKQIEAADRQATNLQKGIETLLDYKSKGLPISDNGIEKGLNTLLDLAEVGSKKAPEVIVALAKKDSATITRILNKVAKDAEQGRKGRIDGLLKEITRKK